MMRLISIIMISLLLNSCTSQDKNPKYNQHAIDLNNNAVSLIAKGKLDSALILLDKATDIDKSYYIAYGNKITIYCEMKDYKKQLLKLKTRLKLNQIWLRDGHLPVCYMID